jgi:putative acetyltransferase
MRIVEAGDDAAWQQVRELFLEYWRAFGFSPCFQGFDQEVQRLPGDYAPPGGALAVALVDGEVAGCVALRRFDGTRAEAKRLYVRPAFRGRGVGRHLLDWLAARARTLGYRELVGDTVPQMAVALAMYERYGFVRTEAYSLAPTPGAIYLRLTL